jgi:ribosomal protein S18 acetylase RimI-like enzyme
MPISIKEMDSLEGWAHIVGDYLRKIRKVSDEKRIEEIVDTFRKHLEEKERFAVVAYQNRKPIGYLTGRKYGLVFETSSFYLDENAVKENVGARLVKTLTKKVFDELGFNYFRQNIMLPFKTGKTFKQDLENAGFLIFERCEMKLDPTKTNVGEINLPEDYSFGSFKKENAEDYIAVMCKANQPGHPDLAIYPEMKEVKWTLPVFAGITKNFEALEDTINPQIMKSDEIAGMSVVLRDNPERAYIAEMAIHPDHQRKGLGKNLMKKIIRGCAEQKIKELMLAVSKDNEAAFSLYQKLGFTEVRQYLAITKKNAEVVKA